MSKTGKQSIEEQMHDGIKEDNDPFSPENLSLYEAPDRTGDKEEVTLSGDFLSTSQSTSKLFTAMLGVQREIKGLGKRQDNPFFKSKYADLHDVTEAIKGPTLNNGILYIQMWTRSGDEHMVTVETLVSHPESGEWMKFISSMYVKDHLNPQAIGSCVTYAKRYSLTGLFALAPEDDDGNRAAGIKAVIAKESDKQVVKKLEAEAKKGLEAYEAAHKKLTPVERSMVSKEDRVALREIANGNVISTAANG